MHFISAAQEERQQNPARDPIFFSCPSRRMDFSKITFASAFPMIHGKMDPVTSILSLPVTATIYSEMAPPRELKCRTICTKDNKAVQGPCQDPPQCTSDSQENKQAPSCASTGGRSAGGGTMFSPISHTMVESGSAGPALAKARKCTKMIAERKRSEYNQLLLPF